MTEYFDTLESFYNEKLKYLSKKDKYTHCNECPEDKVFAETNKEIMISCGSDDTTSCGKQIHITFPEYIHYSSKLDDLEKELENQINWEVINKFTDVKQELKEQTEKEKDTKQAIEYIHELFNDINLKHKEEALQEFYNNRIKKTKRTQDILSSLKKDELSDSKKKEMRREYITYITEMRKEYELAKHLIDDINPYLETSPPKVKIYHKKYKEESEKKKKKKGKKDKEDKKKDKEDKEDKKKDKKKDKEAKKKDKEAKKKENVPMFEDNQRVRWESVDKARYIYGNVISKKGAKLYKVKDNGGKAYIIPVTKLELVEEGEPEPGPE
jgi:chemotaxis protein histidine kinase CheA